MGKGLFHDLECPMVTESPAIYPHHPQLVMEHLVVNDVFDHISRNSWAIQHRVNSYDSFVRAIASETYGPGPTSSFARSPGDGATESSSEIDLVESLEIACQIDMLSLRTRTRVSGLCGTPGSPDVPFVILDEGSQKAFLPDGRPPDERGKRSQHILCCIKKHLMEPHQAGPASPSHGDHGSRIVRDRQRQRDVKNLPQL
jgi:hypothetical protein